MATSSVGFIVPAQDLRAISALVDKASSDIPVGLVITNALGTAVTAGLYTCTADLGGYDPLQCQALINGLRGLGYDTAYSGHILTLRW